MFLSQTTAYSITSVLALTACSVEAGVIKNSESEAGDLILNDPRDIFENDGEENSPINQSSGITEIEIFNGTIANLHCAIQATYVGQIRWWSLEQDKPLSNAQAVGEHLTITDVKEDQKVACEVSKAGLAWQMIFSIKVVNSREELKKGRLSMPSLLEAYLCEDRRTTQILTMSNSGVNECEEETFRSYQSYPVKEMTILHRNRITPIQVNRCHARLASVVALCQDRVP